MNEYYHTIKQQLNQLEKYNINQYYIENKFPDFAWSFIMKNVVSPFLKDDKPNGLEICQLFEALGYASEDGGLNFAIGAHSLAAVIPFIIYASEEQKEKYLSKITTGKLICTNAITETEAGSDIFSMSTKAIKKDKIYKLSGSKTFCSNIKEADLVIVYAVTNKEKGAHGGISSFILEKEEFSVGQTYSKMGLRTCSIGEVLLENIEINENSLLGHEGAGMGIFTTAMDWERIGLASTYIGTMQRLFEMSLSYSKNRVQGGKNIGKYQAVSHKIAEMKTLITSCRLLVLDASKELGIERSVSEKASMCKYFVSETYVKICEMAMQIHGGNGYMEEYGIERCLRDAHASTIYSGTTEIQKNIISKWNGL
jgi:alkylation response protein AidB-like acyl-CoA dehydrogenase